MINRRISLENFPKEDTAIWSCTTEGCKVWMRDRLSFDDIPTCQICLSPMVKKMKELPMLANSEHDLKSMIKSMMAN